MRGSVFAFESFLMSGGWLVFGDSQLLYAPRVGGLGSSERSERMTVPPKLVLPTLKNIDTEIVLNPWPVAPFLMKSSF